MIASATGVFEPTRTLTTALATNAQLSTIVPLFWDAPAFAESLQTISELVRLPENWDTYGSPRVQRAAVRRAVEVLAVAQAEPVPQPRIVPVAGGGLQVEWGMGARELEIEMLPDGSVEVLMVEGELMSEMPLPVERIYPLVPMLLGWLAAETAHAAAIR